MVLLLTMMQLMMRRYPSLPGGEVRIYSKLLVQTQKVGGQLLTHAAAAAAAAKARRRKLEPLEADPHGPKINEGEEEFDPESLVVSKVRPARYSSRHTAKHVFESCSRPCARQTACHPTWASITCSSRNLF